MTCNWKDILSGGSIAINDTMAVFTAWMAYSTGRMARATKQSVDEEKKSVDFNQGIAHLRLITEILEIFEAKVLDRTARYDTPIVTQMGRSARGKHRNRDIPLLYFNGPTDHSFDHPEFLERTHTQKRVQQQSGDVFSIQILNGLEQFASIVLEARDSLGVDEKKIFRPTAAQFIQLINRFYDVVCFERSQSPWLYSAVVTLYTIWEPMVIHNSIEQHVHMERGHGLVRTVRNYHGGVGMSFKDFDDPRSTLPLGEAHGQKSAQLRLESNADQVVWIQVVDETGLGITGWPMTLTLEGATIIKVLAGQISARTPPTNFLTIYGNSTGTVVLQLKPDSSGSNATVNITVDESAI
ncbi:MAG: hypothetical protein M1318_00940 [Firmicutes bacterium]|nr:hypothetical protein [Bacillota bacterium]